MLSNYKAAMIDNNYKVAALITDTATIQPRFNNLSASNNLKVNISDTANMLSKYYNKTLTDALLNGKQSSLNGIGYAKLNGNALSYVSSIPNSDLTNSTITIGSTPISLGGSATTLTGLTSVSSTSFTGALTGNATGLSSTLAISSGGTGLTTTPTNGQIDIGNGTGFTRTTITAGSGITVTNGSGTITIANTGSGSTYTAGTGISITGNTIATTGAVTSALSGLTTDVTITTPSAGQLLQYNGSNWINIVSLVTATAKTYSSSTTYSITVNNTNFTTIFLSDNATLKGLNKIIPLTNSNTGALLNITLPDPTKNNGKSIILRPTDNNSQINNIYYLNASNVSINIDTNLTNLTRAGNLVHVMSDGSSWQVISSR
jgi:hypothetical protein